MTTSTVTLHQQVHDALAGDRILNALGFDHRTIGEQTSSGPSLVIEWDDQWYGSEAAILGMVTIEPLRVDGHTRRVVLDRIEVVLSSIDPLAGPVARITRRPTGTATFAVLGHLAVRVYPIRSTALAQ